MTARAAALALTLFAALAPATAPAQEAEAPPRPEDPSWLPEIPGLDQMTDAARKALEELREQLTPALRQLREAVGMLDDYGPPEILPNGDILIPRRPSDEAAPEPPRDPPASETAPPAPTLEL